MWFEEAQVPRQLIYHLRLTKHRRNVQILVSQLAWRAREGDFFFVIHDGRRSAFYVPFSWLQARVLSRQPSIRQRPSNPSQRYYTVYPIGRSSTRFSFGPDQEGTTVAVDLARFLNTVSSVSKARVILDATRVRNWEDRMGGIVSLRRDQLASSVRRNLSSFQSSIANEGLAGHGGTVVVTSKGDILAVRKERGASTSRVVAMYEQMLRTGQVSGKLSATVAASRPFQRALRLVALDIYGHRCAMCDIDIPSQLVTSHIVPVGRGPSSVRPLPSNTILLCRLHDGLFGQGLISVLPNYRIVCAAKLRTKSRLLQQWAVRLHGTLLSLPSRHPPGQMFLKDHARRSRISIVV